MHDLHALFFTDLSKGDLEGLGSKVKGVLVGNHVVVIKLENHGGESSFTVNDLEGSGFSGAAVLGEFLGVLDVPLKGFDESSDF